MSWALNISDIFSIDVSPTNFSEIKKLGESANDEVTRILSYWETNLNNIDVYNLWEKNKWKTFYLESETLEINISEKWELKVSVSYLGNEIIMKSNGYSEQISPEALNDIFIKFNIK